MAPRKESWIKKEDVVLCLAWITVGGDGATGKDQVWKELWIKIVMEYKATKSADCQTRTYSSCDSCFKKIAQGCMKLSQALNDATLLHRSGENNNNEVMQAKSIFYNNNKAKEFVFEHCWPILMNCQKFSNPPSMNFCSPRFPPPIDLEDEGTPSNDMAPSSSTRQPRPQGQKAQKAAKKKPKNDNFALVRLQMERFGDQSDREYAQRQFIIEEMRAAEQRAEQRAEKRDDERERRAKQRTEEIQKRVEDAHTMQVDLRIFTPNKRAYWQRKQQRIIDMELKQGSSAPEHPQAPTPPNATCSDLTTYAPLHDTQWIPSNNES